MRHNGLKYRLFLATPLATVVSVNLDIAPDLNYLELIHFLTFKYFVLKHLQIIVKKMDEVHDFSVHYLIEILR